MSGQDAARDRMLSELKGGALGAEPSASAEGDASSKRVLIRGCDPVMAERAKGFLPALIGNAQIESCTDDSTFFQKLQTHKWDVITFAPGACRFSGARQPIPGGNVETRGWSLLEYREKVKELQGAEIAIVETTQEAEMVPLLRQALDLPP